MTINDDLMTKMTINDYNNHKRPYRPYRPKLIKNDHLMTT